MAALYRSQKSSQHDTSPCALPNDAPEGKLDERLPSNRYKKIDNLVGIEKQIEKLVLLTEQGSHLIGKERVKAHIPESELLMTAQHLRLPNPHATRAARDRFPQYAP
jgi:hypothetical protein